MGPVEDFLDTGLVPYSYQSVKITKIKNCSEYESPCHIGELLLTCQDFSWLIFPSQRHFWVDDFPSPRVVYVTAIPWRVTKLINLSSLAIFQPSLGERLFAGNSPPSTPHPPAFHAPLRLVDLVSWFPATAGATHLRWRLRTKQSNRKSVCVFPREKRERIHAFQVI